MQQVGIHPVRTMGRGTFHMITFLIIHNLNTVSSKQKSHSAVLPNRTEHHTPQDFKFGASSKS